MANSAIILASTLCFLSMFGSCYCSDRFFVEGKVYCDTCRTQFLTRLSEFMEGATVHVECKEENGTMTFTKEAVTDASGSYRVEVDGDHEEEVCEVVLVKSPRSDCLEVDRDSHLEQAAKISITNNNGIISHVRAANPFGFLIKDRAAGCVDVLKELGIKEGGTLLYDDDN
ncbi:Allergen Ole e 1, conserved site [Sesbania bispinosa]|nr:Allergen Ole e 1, conserved site [Sesbania bispinosa]